MGVKEAVAKYASPFEAREDDRGLCDARTDWEIVQLTSVATLESGHTPSRRHSRYWNGGIPWVSLHDTELLDRREILDTTNKISAEGLRNSSARLLPKGTVVFSRTATVGKATTLGCEMATSQDFANYVCGPKLHNHFLVHLFRSMAPLWRKMMAGSIHNTIYMPVFKRLAVPLPCFREQQIIADALGDVDSLIDALAALLTKKRQIKQGAMQALLSSNFRLPGFDDPWMGTSLGKLGAFYKGRGVSRAQARSGSIPCIRYGELYTAHEDVIREFDSWISESVAAEALALVHGDILFAASGETKAEIGKCAAFVDRVRACAGGDIIVLRPSGCDSRFLGYALNAPSVARQKSSFGQGDAVVHVSAAALASVEINLPKLAEQTAIAQVLSDMDADIAALEARLTKARQLKQGMMQQLLTGRIRLPLDAAA
jgi:type I restriction enzyme, S subunit